jgi:hypothetical protein
MKAARLLIASTVPAAVAVTGAAYGAPPWVDRDVTLPAGDWAFDFGLGIGHVPDEVAAGVNTEGAVGITSHLELGLRTGLRPGYPPDRDVRADQYGRLFDRQTFATGADPLANPEVRVRGALVRGGVAEVALEGRVVLPFETNTAAGILFGVPLAFHLGGVVRLDTGVYAPIIFYDHDTELILRAPVDVWIQAGPRLWLGPMGGVEFVRVGDNRGRAETNLSLGFGLGYQFLPTLDLKTMLLFPSINNASNDFGVSVGVQVRIE